MAQVRQIGRCAMGKARKAATTRRGTGACSYWPHLEQVPGPYFQLCIIYVMVSLRKLTLSTLLVSIAAAAPAGGQEYVKYLIPRESTAPASTTPLSLAAAVSDLAALEELFREAYSGYEYFERSGTDWARTFSEARKALGTKAEWPPEEYFAFLAERLKTAGLRDNHLALKLDLPGKQLRVAPYSSHWTPYFSDRKVFRRNGRTYLDDGAELLEVQGEPPDGSLFPSFDPSLPGEVFLLGSFGPEPSRSLRCSIKTDTGPVSELRLELHPIRNVRRRAAPVFETRSLAGGVVYIALRSLQNAHAAALERFVRSADEARAAPALILDLRGNAGGSDGWGNRWLAGLTGGPIRPDRSVRVLISPATLQGEVNYLADSLAEAGDYASRDRIGQLLTAANKRLAAGERAGVSRHWEPRNYEWRGTAEAPFAGTLLVLSDAWNASAGESFLETLRLPGARVVVLGGNSMGVNTFGPLYTYRLPASGIKVYLPQGITMYRKDRLFETSGVPPDVWIDEEDVLPAALEYARRLLAKPPPPVPVPR